MYKIVITGAHGQLGQCLQKLESDYPQYKFVFASAAELDITDEGNVQDFFNEHRPHYCINAAAYTKVDLAEKEPQKAFAVNVQGVENLAQACKAHAAILIHISTDYVFGGDTLLSYDEEAWTAPTGVYGRTKLEGEERALEENPHTLILRTSWLYSEFGKNFVKTMLSLFKTKDELGIVADQYGQPTYAVDLAEAIMHIVAAPRKHFGIYHFSNYGETTWFGFAKEIAHLSGASIPIKPLTTAEYPTPAPRPARSTLALDKIERDYGIEPQYWQNSLATCLENLKD